MSITLKPEYSNSLKKNIANSPALHIKCIYSTATEYTKRSVSVRKDSMRKEIEKSAEKEKENLLNKLTEESKQFLPVINSLKTLARVICQFQI